MKENDSNIDSDLMSTLKSVYAGFYQFQLLMICFVYFFLRSYTVIGYLFFKFHAIRM